MFRKSVLFCLLLSAAIVTNGFAQQATESAKGGRRFRSDLRAIWGQFSFAGLKKRKVASVLKLASGKAASSRSSPGLRIKRQPHAGIKAALIRR